MVDPKFLKDMRAALKDVQDHKKISETLNVIRNRAPQDRQLVGLLTDYVIGLGDSIKTNVFYEAWINRMEAIGER